jgi:hypothetical protein
MLLKPNALEDMCKEMFQELYIGKLGKHFASDGKVSRGVAPALRRDCFCGESKKISLHNFLLYKDLRVDDNGLEPMTFWLPGGNFQVRLSSLP